jgi:DNA-binding IclR family transcriptional regulator
MTDSSKAGSGQAQESEAPAYPIGSVDSALRLLLLLGERSQVRVADAAKELGVAPSTAHRLLQMLLFYGFVRQEEVSKAYVPGPAWVTMGLQGVRDLDIRRVARAELQALVDSIGETVQLLTLQPGGQVVCLDAIEGPSVVRAAGRLGAVLPAQATAGGRVLLAGLTPQRLNQLRLNPTDPDLPLNKFRTRAALDKELAKIRKEGFGVQRDELEPGVSAIAAPISGVGGDASFAIDVVMPSSRLRDEDVESIAKSAIEAAERISAHLS